MLHSNRMWDPGRGEDEFQLRPPELLPPDEGWPSALLFESPEQIYQRVYRVLRPRSVAPPVKVRFEKFANADSRIRFQDGALSVRVTDLLEGAPSPIQEALAFILMAKLLRQKIPKIYGHRYRLFLNGREMRARAQAVRQERGHKLCANPQGTVFDLVEVFETLNGAHFHGLMARPRLGWSLQASRTRLGHFDPSHNAIVISRIFDRPGVRRLALDYVMFHEMLHLRFPVETRGARRCVHTREFKAAEKEFPQFAEARKLLKLL